jgi:fructose-bisphosphate aldolase class I
MMMFAIVHQMRTRIITSPSFTGERIIAVILFENTMDRDIEGRPTADYLWNVTSVVPSKVLRVVALSGGYAREEANDRLRRNHGIVASFSRALVEGLSAQQSDAEFNAVLDGSIQSIFAASNT